MSLDQLQIIEAAGIGLTSLLRTQSELLADTVHRHGNPIAQRIKPGKVVPSTGPNGGEGGWEFQMRTGYADTARATRDASRDFRAPRKSTADKIRVRFSIDDTTKNDIARIDTAARVHVADLKRSVSNPGVALDIVKNAMNDATMGIDQTIETLMHADENALIGLVNGTPKAADDLFYSEASSYSSGTTARIKVDAFSFAFFKTNMYLDIYSSAGALQADAVRVYDVNEADFSFTIAVTDDSTVANLDSVADNAYIYRSGEKGQGFKASFGSLFKEDYTGDSWFGGIDRSASDKGHYVPVRTRVGESSSVALSNRVLDKLFRSLGYRKGTNEPGRRPAIVTGMEAVDNWRYSVSDTVTLQKPAVNDGKLQEGDDGLTYVHPAVGRVDIVTTLTARNDRVIVMYPDDWEMLSGDFAGLQYLSGNGSNVWERVPGTNTHGGGSVFYRMEAMAYMAPFCSAPNMQGCVFNIT